MKIGKKICLTFVTMLISISLISGIYAYSGEITKSVLQEKLDNYYSSDEYVLHKNTQVTVENNEIKLSLDEEEYKIAYNLGEECTFSMNLNYAKDMTYADYIQLEIKMETIFNIFYALHSDFGYMEAERFVHKVLEYPNDNLKIEYIVVSPEVEEIFEDVENVTKIQEVDFPKFVDVYMKDRYGKGYIVEDTIEHNFKIEEKYVSEGVINVKLTIYQNGRLDENSEEKYHFVLPEIVLDEEIKDEFFEVNLYNGQDVTIYDFEIQEVEDKKKNNVPSVLKVVGVSFIGILIVLLIAIIVIRMINYTKRNKRMSSKTNKAEKKKVVNKKINK